MTVKWRAQLFCTMAQAHQRARRMYAKLQTNTHNHTLCTPALLLPNTHVMTSIGNPRLWWLLSREGERVITACRPLVPIHIMYNPVFRPAGRVYALLLSSLTNDQLAVLWEVVFGDLEVERSRSFPDAARDVVVGAVAGAEPTAVVAGLADGHATQMCADACSLLR